MKTKTKVCILAVLAIVCIGGISLYRFLSPSEVKINDQLAQLSRNSEWSLGSIDIDEEWDSVLIIKPYDLVEEYTDIQIRFIDRQALSFITMGNEGLCSLGFLHSGELVAYAVVPRATFMDFSTTEQRKYPRNARFTLVDKKVYDTTK